LDIVEGDIRYGEAPQFCPNGRTAHDRVPELPGDFVLPHPDRADKDAMDRSLERLASGFLAAGAHKELTRRDEDHFRPAEERRFPESLRVFGQFFGIGQDT
jgi:hypothetical protein